MIESVLVANRGEIALRVIRGAKEMGIRTVAVFSEADRTAPHVLHADEAYPIGPARASESYLASGRLLEVARRSGVEAVHPGYGFLAERADFAEAVAGAGLIFVGPAAGTIRAMGDKTEARRRMAAAGVPVVPGTDAPLESAQAARRAAIAVGLPVVMKAAAGGGGKGMRVVRRVEEADSAFEAAAREAEAAFGDGRVYVERFLERPRHVEIQIFGDRHGSAVHLFERECSIQRRHQKLIEEAPSPLLGPEERQRMGEAAVRAARAVDYTGAGTVEFLYAGEEFFFLEMNTRLQVEHPVTEMVTGLDLVEWQFRVAAGEPLPLRQSEIPMRGHAIECRITSESPFDGFLPATGVVGGMAVPGGPWVRWDGGIAEGMEIGLHYDPLIGKLVTWAPDRTGAIRRMERALGELRIDGVATSAPLMLRIMREPDFLAGRLSTAYLPEHPALFEAGVALGEGEVLAVAAALLEHGRRRSRAAPRIRRGGTALSAWQRSGAGGGGRGPHSDGRQAPGAPAGTGAHGRRGPPMNAQGVRYVVEVEGTSHEVEIGADGSAGIGGRCRAASLVEVGRGGGWSLLLDGVSVSFVARCTGRGGWEIEMDGRTVGVRVLEAREAEIRKRAAKVAGRAGIAPLKAPMPGLVVRVAACEGDVVQPGTAILIVEAMKMENELRAAAAARIARILVSEGDAVEKAQVLAEFEELEAP